MGRPRVEAFCPDLAEGPGGEVCQLARKLDVSRGGYLELFREWGYGCLRFGKQERCRMVVRGTAVEGVMFLRNYLRPVTPLEDSPRARLRLARYFEETMRPRIETFVRTVERELGINYPHSGGRYQHERFWTRTEIADVLSAITIWFVLVPSQAAFLVEARRIFREEHLRYRLDDKGGVHFLVDEEFERTVAAAVAGLGAPRFTASRNALHEATAHLGATRQSGKGLIRGVFEAVESAFLVVIGDPKVNRLNGDMMDKHLKPLLMARYASHGDAEDLAGRFMDHFKAWVKSAHPFRHGTTSEQIHEAPLDLAIMSATQGIGYLRFLASLPDQL